MEKESVLHKTQDNAQILRLCHTLQSQNNSI